MSNEKTPDASQDPDDPRVATLIRGRGMPTPRTQIRTAVLYQAGRRRHAHSVTRPAFMMRYRSAIGAVAASLLVAVSLSSWYVMGSKEATSPNAPIEPLLVSASDDDTLYGLDRALDALQRRVEGIRPKSRRPSPPATRASGTLLQRARGMRLRLENRNGNVTNAKQERNSV